MLFVNNFNDYILKELDTTFFILSDRLFDILMEINHPISSNLRKDAGENPQKNVTLIDMIEYEQDKWSFVNSNKANQYIEEIGKNPEKIQSVYTNKKEINNKFSSNAKIGRIINKIYPIKYKPNDIETFINEYKKILTKDFDLIDIVQGGAIRHWYNCNHYNDDDVHVSELHNSCMSSEIKNHFTDLYTINSDNISMVILYSDDDKEKIDARAILWKPDKINGEDNIKGDLFMDRIYYNKQEHKNILQKYAEKNNWYYKKTNNSVVSSKIYNPYTKKEEQIIFEIVELKIPEHRKFPYVDTIAVYNPKTNTLSNNENQKNIGILSSTMGYLENLIWLGDKNKFYHENEIVEAVYNDNGYIKVVLHDEAEYLPRYNKYYTKEYLDNSEIVEVQDPYEILDDKNNAPFYKVFKKDTVESNDGKIYFKGDTKYSNFFDNYIPNHKAVYSKYMSTYLPRGEGTVKVITDIFLWNDQGNQDVLDNLDEIEYSYDYRLKDEPVPSYFEYKGNYYDDTDIMKDLMKKYKIME